jgi:hypothetical protein
MDVERGVEKERMEQATKDLGSPATGMLPCELPKREGIITTSFAVVALSVVQGLTMGPPSRQNL